jgi:GAF domain-containing protein/ANTAR domain-containing protein
VATPSASPPRPGEPGSGLTNDLITLAGTPDDGSDVPVLLRSITQLTADLLPPVTYASVTVHQNDADVTVAMSSQVALAVDKAQYAEDSGPCLDTLRTAEPTVVPRIDAMVNWPGFRAEARRLGLHASLSIPLFAARGTPIAALNLYSRDTRAMAPLSVAVLATFESSGDGKDEDDFWFDDLDPGALDLLDGLTGAFAVRTKIQQAFGVVMAGDRVSADAAYTVLRSRAAATGLSLITAAESVVNRAGNQPHP